MALCRTCDTVIPCHCHLAPPTQIRPGVYLTTRRQLRDRGAHPVTHHQPAIGQVYIACSMNLTGPRYVEITAIDTEAHTITVADAETPDSRTKTIPAKQLHPTTRTGRQRRRIGYAHQPEGVPAWDQRLTILGYAGVHAGRRQEVAGLVAACHARTDRYVTAVDPSAEVTCLGCLRELEA